MAQVLLLYTGIVHGDRVHYYQIGSRFFHASTLNLISGPVTDPQFLINVPLGNLTSHPLYLHTINNESILITSERDHVDDVSLNIVAITSPEAIHQQLQYSRLLTIPRLSGSRIENVETSVHLTANEEIPEFDVELLRRLNSSSPLRQQIIALNGQHVVPGIYHLPIQAEIEFEEEPSPPLRGEEIIPSELQSLRAQLDSLVQIQNALLSHLYGLPVQMPTNLTINGISPEIISFPQVAELLSSNQIGRYIFDPQL